MALPQDFMERVVAWPGPDGPGYVNLHWKSPKGPGFRGKPFKDLQEFMSFAQYAATKPGAYKDIYFCLSTQSATGKVIHNHATAARLKQNAIRLKAIWLDVDVKPEKGYGTLEEALEAIAAFREAAALPAPSALVFSGGGVHVYWISETPLPPAEWRPYAEGLKEAALKHGLRCDAGITTDEARVLRIPGTYNHNTTPPKTVRLAHLGVSYDFARDLVAIAALAPTRATGIVTAAVKPAPFDLRAFAAGPSAAFQALPAAADCLADGIGRPQDDRPLDPSLVFQNCVHFQDAATTHGAKHSQGLWMQTVLASTWFEDGRRWAHYFSKGYPTYDQSETDAMYDRKLKDREGSLGWPGCHAFESEGAKCKTCPFYQKLRSPLNLAERVVVPGVVVVPAPAPPEDLELPAGYTVDPTSGLICEIIDKKMPNGDVIQESLPLFMSRLRNFTAQGGLSRKLLFETSLDLHKWGGVSIVEATDLITEQTVVKALRRDGVKPHPDNQKRIIKFMTSFMAKLDNARNRIETIPYGWVRSVEGGDLPIGFAYGGRVVLAGGSNQRAGYADQQLESMYKPTGDVALWYKALKIVTSQNHPALEAIIATTFAAPLLVFTGKYNSVACPWSPQGGTHKSTSIHIGAAVWGSPKRTKERPTASQKGLLHKLGQIKNLPVYLDEVNDNDKMDTVRTMLGDATEGGTGSKLHQDRTFFEQDEWQTLLVVGANKSLIENILNNTKSTDSQLQRVFEFLVEPRPDTHTENEVSQLINALDYNYGHVGLAYSEVLGRDPAGIRGYVNEIATRFNAEVTHSSPERFRSAMAATCYAGAELANRHLQCDFHLPELWAFLKAEYLNQRSVIKQAEIVSGTQNNTANSLAQFFKSCTRNALWVGTMAAPGAGRPSGIVYIAGPTREHPDQVHVRLCVNDRVIEVSRQRLIDYMTFIKQDGASVVNGLREHFAATVHHKINLAAGSGVLGGRETIIRIPVPDGSPFLGALYAHTPPADRPVGVVINEQDDGVTVPVT